ncbi:MAG: flagellar motor protein MotB [Arcobacter sp.]|jgi:chemotaxis protein MotB|uniref:Flagellar motor stator protein n=1 Tax=Arcobacter defluvii TaxID=873191 RepID=A0AAE7BG63_9BACT|nr:MULTISPECIES: flagellar motor protein MotB [Arcobacter]MDY3200131.1 flagellar motor protein MotB [Arcobacter sp.]QKF78478.1 flagellar motor stator protein [Arcobacter defluvii]RXI31326.1 flagellar motor protein MotB [Arcobacter defluvii]BAK74258.1 putative motility protein [Arcobacter sp. L]
MAKNKCPECPKCLPGWLVQFGDLMSLLLTFFILLLSMAVMDKKKVEEYFDIMKKAMGFIDASTDVETQTDAYSTKDSSSDSQDSSDSSTESSFDNTAQEVSQIVQELNSNQNIESQEISIEKGKNEFTLDIPSTIMFEDGQYELTNQSAKIFISKIARVIRTMPQTFNIEIIGHTDTNRVISDKIPRDAWDISALRSISVVKELIKNKIDPGILKVSAFGSYHPKSDVAADNRRVEMRFYSQDNQQDILNEENFFDRLE